MILDIQKYGLYLVLTTALFISGLAEDADEPINEPPTDRGKVLELIDQGLPEPLRGDIGALVTRMMNAKIGPPLSQTFNPTLAIQRLLGRGARLDPECRQVFTESGDPDSLPCVASVGTADGPGPYRQLGYAKHMALGNIGYFNRPADRDIGIGDLKPVTMTDEEAYKAAQEWLASFFGLGPDEMPVAPVNDPRLRNPLPVKTIAMGAMDEAGNMQSVEVEKLVVIARGLFTGLGGDFDWLPAPGKAIVAMDDVGVNEALIRDWQELVPDPAVDPRNAKTIDVLKDEIADDLLGAMKGQITRIQVVLGFRVRAPVDNKDLRGLLLPAVQVFVSSVPADMTEEEQQALARTQVSTASFIREFSLVQLPVDNEAPESE